MSNCTVDPWLDPTCSCPNYVMPLKYSDLSC